MERMRADPEPLRETFLPMKNSLSQSLRRRRQQSGGSSRAIRFYRLYSVPKIHLLEIPSNRFQYIVELLNLLVAEIAL